MRTLALALCLAVATPVAAAPMRPHVYLVVVDGLGADELDRAIMPRLAEAARAEGAVRAEARACMPTRTNPNHVTLLTGLLPEGHGVTGNGFWERAERKPRALDAAELVEAETFFTLAHTTRPALVTVAAFSKAKLGKLFAAVPDRQRAPDVLWIPEVPDGAGHVTGVASDAETMDAFLRVAAEREPDLGVVNLSEVDRTAHRDGPGRTAEARTHADAAIGRLMDDLQTRVRWSRSIVIVTADHGFDDVAPAPERPEPVIALSARFAAAGIAGVHVVADGGSAHVYADAIGPRATRAGRGTTALAWAAAIAWQEPGVAEIFARLPVPGVTALDTAHPEWGLAHERSGDLFLVARPGFAFVDAADAVSRTFRGNHGSAREARVPLVIVGGALARTGTEIASPPTAADIGATIGALLGLRTPRRFDGRAVSAGHPLRLPLRTND